MSKQPRLPEPMLTHAEVCVICGREETPENPIYPALAVYLRASRPIPVCHECLTAEVRESEPASIEDAA